MDQENQPITECTSPEETPTPSSPPITIDNKDDKRKEHLEPIYEALTHHKIEKNEDAKYEKQTNIEKERKETAPAVTPIVLHNDREQRRKFRVEKKLQEMNKVETNNDSSYNILDFAENFFNSHERLVDGTLMSTITRKGKKVGDITPKHEMIVFTKSEKIPTSHIHMYDPENIALSCNIFRVSLQLLIYLRINSD